MRGTLVGAVSDHLIVETPSSGLLSDLYGEPVIETAAVATATTGLAIASGLRDPEQYAAAAAGAGGDRVEEIDACVAVRGDTIWCPDGTVWFAVKDSHTKGAEHTIYGHQPRKTTMTIAAPRPVLARYWVVDADRPVVRRVTGATSDPEPRITDDIRKSEGDGK